MKTYTKYEMHIFTEWMILLYIKYLQKFNFFPFEMVFFHLHCVLSLLFIRISHILLNHYHRYIKQNVTKE